MKYKVGDKVRIKSIDWYNQNKDENGVVKCGDYTFTYPMTKLCSKIVTIRCVNTKDCYYVISEDDGYNSWTEEIIEGLVEKGIPLNVSLTQEQINKLVHDSCVLFCKHCECGIPRETCTSLGTCKEHDAYRDDIRTCLRKNEKVN